MKHAGTVALILALAGCSDPNRISEEAVVQAEGKCSDARGWAHSFPDDKAVATSATDQCDIASVMRQSYDTQERKLDERIRRAARAD